MRLKLVLKIVEGTVLPCNYMYELSSCLYKVLNEGNPVFTAWLHDKGYCKEKKAFKLFTFSNFYFPCFRIEGDRIFVLADTAQLIVSFYPIEAIDAFVMEYPKKKIKTIYYNGIGNRTSWCPVRIQGKPETKVFAWATGIGNSTGAGFGSIY